MYIYICQGRTVNLPKGNCNGPSLTRKDLFAGDVPFQHVSRFYLVGGFNPSEKISQGLLCPIYGKIKVMFQSPPINYNVSGVFYGPRARCARCARCPHGVISMECLMLT